MHIRIKAIVPMVLTVFLVLSILLTLFNFQIFAAESVDIEAAQVRSSSDLVTASKVDTEAKFGSTDEFTLSAGSNWTGNAPIITWNSPAEGFNSQSISASFEVAVQLNNTNYVGQDIQIYLYAMSPNKLESMIAYVDSVTENFTSETEEKTLSFNDMVIYHEGEIEFFLGFFVGDPALDSEETPVSSYFTFETPLTIVYDPTIVYRFYSDVYSGHFYTTSKSERDNVRNNNPNWNFEGEKFKVSPSKSDGTCQDEFASPVYRFWSSVYERHFYTISASEANAVLENPEWDLYNGVVFCAYDNTFFENFPEAFAQVFRFWNLNQGGHFYTDSVGEKNQVEQSNPNWTYEFVAFAAKDSI